MERGFSVAGLIGTLQADEAGQGGSAVVFQPEDFVGGMVSLPFARVVEVGAQQGGVAEDALDLDGVTALADFSGSGPVGGVDLVSGFLKELTDKLCGGFA